MNWLRQGFEGGRRLGLALALIAGGLAAVAAPASAGLGFECEPASCEVVVGDTIDVYITVADTVLDLKGASLGIGFDPAIVEVLSLSPGEPAVAGCFSPFDPPFVGVAGDSIYIDTAGLGCSLDGPFRLVCIRLRGLMVGVSPLVWEAIDIRNSLNQHLPCVGADGQVRVIDEPIPARVLTWGRLKARHGGDDQAP